MGAGELAAVQASVFGGDWPKDSTPLWEVGFLAHQFSHPTRVLPNFYGGMGAETVPSLDFGRLVMLAI